MYNIDPIGLYYKQITIINNSGNSAGHRRQCYKTFSSSIRVGQNKVEYLSLAKNFLLLRPEAALEELLSGPPDHTLKY
jgi:hypothetical protein